MIKHKFLNVALSLMVVFSLFMGGSVPVSAQIQQPSGTSPQSQAPQPIVNDEIGTSGSGPMQMRQTTQAQRMAAAAGMNIQHKGVNINLAGLDPALQSLSPFASTSESLATMAEPNAAPDYFGIANWANSPLPQINAAGAVVPGTGMRKFVDALPGLCGVSPLNDLGQCIPLAAADSTTFTGSDYYEIAVVEYYEQMHADLPLPGTKLRGYVQVVPSTYPGAVPLTTANGLTMNILDRQGLQVYGATKPHYLGPMIVATGCDLNANPTTCVPRPVRVKFTNYLPTGPGGDLFIPTDTSYMGAGMGPGGSIGKIIISNSGAGYTSAPGVVFTGGAGTGAAATATVINGKVTDIKITNGGSGYTSAPVMSFTGGDATTPAAATAVLAGVIGDVYTQNRATLHLHGGNTPWISDGTPHQWTTPFGQATSYSKGVSAAYVPDMWFDANGNLVSACAGLTTCSVAGASTDPGLGSLTFFWTNQQSGRLLFYHDHSYGITRLNVYAGEAAGYLIVDPAQENALAAAAFPGTLGTTPDLAHLIPLVIQDKTFVPDSGAAGGQLAATDPTWDLVKYGGKGNLWFPHVYMPNQNPADVTGANPFGRWDYGAWFWPAQDPTTYVPGGQPYQCTSAAYPAGSPPAFPPLMCPGIPTPSGTPEGFLDTPVVNGTAYPTLTVDPTAYRFQMLMAGNDRTWNLGLYVADPLSIAVTNGGINYTTAPVVGFVGGGGSGAIAAAQMSNGSVTSVLITNVGAGYTVPPNVSITGNGNGAVATAAIDAFGHLELIKIVNGGSGYTSATVTIDAPLGCTTGCVTALATATVTPPGSVLGVHILNPGAGWTSAPAITFTGGGGTGAAAIASINTEVKMVEAAPHTPSDVLPLCSIANDTSGAQLVLANFDANGNPLNGTGLQAGCWPTTWPTDGRDGGVPDPLTAGPPFIQIGTESGLLPAPVVIPSTPTSYEYNRRSITVLNIWNHGLLLGPAERADVVVDFSQYAGKTLILYNDAPTPVPAFDPRTDYYTGDPDQTASGGAPTTLPGYGPNTRTVMQIKVNAVAAGGTGALSNVTLTNGGAGYTAPSVAITGGGGTGAAATATGKVTNVTLTSAGTGYTNPVITFSGGGGSGAAAVFSSGVLSGLTMTAPGAGYATMPIISFSGGGGSLASAVATGSVDSVALSAPGSGYASTAVSLTGGGGSGATASATGAVNAVAVNANGAGYTSMPTVALTNAPGDTTGLGATAAATGAVDAVAVTANGGGYATMPVVTFTNAPGDTTGAGAAATATGAVDNIAVTTPGAGYHAPAVSMPGGATGVASGAVDNVLVGTGGTGYTAPVVTLTGGGGTGATASATVVGGVITGFTFAGGSGYTSAPAVNITDVGPGTGATATATQTGGVITAITPGAAGSGYLNPVVTVTDSGGPGTGAVVTAQQTGGIITGYTIVNGGTGYVSPVLTITDAGLGAGATATTTISVLAIAVSAPGAGYAAAPLVTITDSGTPTTPAAATATLKVTVITVTANGAGYTLAPLVSMLGGATATSTLRVNAIAVTAAGSGYTLAPLVGFTGGGGAGAAATSSLRIATLSLGLPGTGYASAPVVNFTGGGTGATGTTTLKVSTLTITSPGAGYTSAPAVIFTGGGGAGAAATAQIVSTGITITNNGSGYTSAPAVLISDTPPGTGSGATAVATLGLTGVTLTNPGTGYTSLPVVTISDTPPGTGAGAAAVANLAGGNPVNLAAFNTAATNVFVTQQKQIIVKEPYFPAGNGGAATPTYLRITDTSLPGWIGGAVQGVTLVTGGAGYASAPTASITGGGGSGATLSVMFAGAIVNSLTLSAGGTGYTSAPAVVFTGGGGTGAAASALITRIVNNVTVTNGGLGYTSAPAVVFTGGGGTGAAATAAITGALNSVTVVNRGSGYTSAPSVVFTGGGGTGAAATATISGGRVLFVTITNRGTGYTSAPTVSFTGGGGTGATATASFTRIVSSITVTNPGSGYTSAPGVSFTGGGGGSGARATATITGIVNSLLLTNGGTGYTSAPGVSFTGGGGTGAAATATFLPGTVTGLVLTNGGYGYTSLPSVSFAGGGTPTTAAVATVNTPANPMAPKAIQELFTLDYGRMNATLGVELPFTNFFIQTTIPYGYTDPPTELLQDGQIQIWKITHNGVDTHFIHFHLYDVQVINRVGWDGAIKPPDINEIAWKDTVRMNPLEDIIVALRPMKQQLPWELPINIRPLDVTESIGASNPNNTQGFANIDPGNNPAPVTNDLTNFGFEYVVHCHILGHEENDMMRSQLLAVPPVAPSNVTATRVGPTDNQSVIITWVDNSINETGFGVERSISLQGPWLTLTPEAPASPGVGTARSYTDATVARRTSYYYRVVAKNVVGYVKTYAAPAIGYPTLSADSAPVYAPTPVTTLFAPAEEGPIFADSFETGLDQWSGQINSMAVITPAMMGPHGGKLGMAVSIGNGALPTYLYDLSPNGRSLYDANFYFNPNRAKSDNSPIDIFTGLDMSGQPMFGVQFQTEFTNTYELRGWAMLNDAPVYTEWKKFTPEPGEDDPAFTIHKIETAWESVTGGGFSLYIDDTLIGTLSGSSNAQVNEVLLGPSNGLTANASGTLYFDEFTSSELLGVTYINYLPLVVKGSSTK